MSGNKIIKFGQGNLNFAKFKLKIIELLVKFSLQLDKIWFKAPPPQILKFTKSQATSAQQNAPSVNLADIKIIEFLRNSYL